MKFPRCKFLHSVGGSAAMAAARTSWAPQTYSSRPVRVIVGFAAAAVSSWAFT
jgi:hypothetical protein